MYKDNKKIFTSESVTEGHPDKICDQISDAILDDLLSQDPMARVACETAVTTGLVLVMGEITTTGYCDVQKIVRNTINEIGYNRGKFGFDAENVGVIVSINEQSPDIALGVDTDGAGDQGMMFGYACDETDEYMPMPIVLSHKLALQLSKVRKNGIVTCLRPDGKTQVGVEYDNGVVKRIDSIIVSSQHDEHVSQAELRNLIIENVIKPVVPSELMDENTKIYVNPTVRFVIVGPKGDSGLTGRKIIVDTYGGYARHGGGAFSGKDPTKVDRSASYMARYIAKNMVAAGFAKKMEIQFSYAIGVADPISIAVDTFGTSPYDEATLVKIIRDNFSLTPKGIIETLNLRRPIYKQTASYGHFGRNDLNLPWEALDRVNDLKKFK